MNGKTLLMFLTQAAIWGSSFSMIKLANDGLNPAQLVFVRLVLGATVLAAVAGITSVTLRMSRRTWLHMVVASIFANVLPYLLLSYGERHSVASVAGVLVAGTPLFTLVLATAVFAQENVTARKVLGFVLGFVGVAIVLAPWAESGGSMVGRVACFGAAVSYAIGYAYVGRFMNSADNHPLTLATNQLVAAAALMVPVVSSVPWGSPHLDGKIVTGVLLLGVLSTGFANILYFGLIRAAGATTASAVDYLVPIFAVIFGVIILGEHLQTGLLFGGLVVLLGMGIAEVRISVRRERQRRDEAVVATPVAVEANR